MARKKNKPTKGPDGLWDYQERIRDQGQKDFGSLKPWEKKEFRKRGFKKNAGRSSSSSQSSPQLYDYQKRIKREGGNNFNSLKSWEQDEYRKLGFGSGSLKATDDSGRGADKLWDYQERIRDQGMQNYDNLDPWEQKEFSKLGFKAGRPQQESQQPSRSIGGFSSGSNTASTNASATDPTSRGYQGRQDRVDVLLDDMMEGDSRLMRRSRSQGEAQANRRGMLNSTMAGQASQAAMLDQLVPLASQNASQAFQKNRSGQDYMESRGLQSQQGKIQSRLSEQEAGQRESLARVEGNIRSNLSSQEARQNRRQTRLQGNIQEDQQDQAFRQDKQLARLDAQLTQEQTALEQSAREDLQKMEIRANDRRGAETMLTNAFNDFEDSKRSILSNPNLDGDTRNGLLENANGALREKIDFINTLHSTEFDWPDNPFALAGEGGGGGRSGGGTSGGGNSGGGRNRGGNNRSRNRNRSTSSSSGYNPPGGRLSGVDRT